MLWSIAAISVGAACGAVIRWALGLGLNSMFPTIPPGTLVANCLGGYLIGLAAAFFANHPGLSPEWRLMIITGFMGGLTTFSTFSAEVTTLLQQGRVAWAATAVVTHVGASLILTTLGMLTYSLFRQA